MDQQSEMESINVEKDRLYQDQIDNKERQDEQNLFSPRVQVNQQTKRDEINSLLENNYQFSSNTPSLNYIFQASIDSKATESAQFKFQGKKNGSKNSIQGTEKNILHVPLQQNEEQRSQQSRNIRSMDIIESGKNQIQPSKKISKSNKTSLQQEKKFIDFMLLKQIHQKMIYFLKNFTNYNRVKTLNDENHQNIRKAINDSGDYIETEITDKFIKITRCIINYLTCFSAFKNYCYQSSCFMIVPNSSFNILSLVFFCTFNYLFYFLLSIIIIFEGYMTYEKAIVYLIFFVWILEIFVKINTQIYKKTNLISDREQIIAQYIKEKAIYDLIPLACIFLSTHISQNAYLQKVLQVASFLKLVNVLKDTNNMQKLLCMTVKNYYIIQLFNLVFKISALGHAIACVWYLIGQIELHIYNEETTWYHDSIGSDGVWWKLYLQSMYWSLTLIITGSNEAQTTAQMLYTSFIMLFTAIIYGYLLSTTGIILQQLNQRDEEKRMDLNILNDFMRQQKISKGLQGRVNLDLEYQYLNNLKKDQLQKEEVLSKISPHLQQLLKIEQSKQALEKFNFLSRHFSKETIQDLSLEFYEEFYSPNEVVFAEKQSDKLSMVLILQGSLQIFQQIDRQTQPVELLKEGDVIGQINFFTGLQFEYVVKSVDFTKVIKIDRDKFLDIIQKRPKDYEKYCFIRDQQQFYKQYNFLQTKCGFCSQSSHLSFECNLVHIDKQGSVFVAKLLQNLKQNRSNYMRKSMKQNTFTIVISVQQSANKFINEEKNVKKINTMVLKKKSRFDILSNESSFESENSNKFFSTFQVYSSQQSSDDEEEDDQIDLSLTTAQKINICNQFNQEKIVQLNKRSLRTAKSRDIKEIGEQKQLSHGYQILLDSVHKYENAQKKRDSLLQIKIDKRYQYGSQASDATLNNNSNYDLPYQLIKQRNTQDLSYTPSNLTRRQDFLDVNLQQALKIANLKKRDKKADQGILLRSTKLRKASTQQKPQNLIQTLEEIQQQNQQPLFLFDFDLKKNWFVYFPNGNLITILKNYNKKIKKKAKQNIVLDKKERQKQ